MAEADGPPLVAICAEGPVDEKSATPKNNNIKITDILKRAGSGRQAAGIGSILAELDRDNDGDVDVDELLAMLDGVAQSRRERRYMWFVIIALSIFAICTVGAIVGLTYAVVDALKDTQVSGGVMYVKGSETEVVRTGSAEFAVVDGIMVSREAMAAANSSAPPASVNATLPAQSVLRTATFKGTPQAFSSRIGVQTLMELRSLYIKGSGDVEVCLLVTGVARVPMANSVWGNVVRIVTTAGTITLDDTAISFSDSVVNIFAEAGFTVSRNRRMLLGFYEVLGFFNFIEDLDIFNLAPDQPKPRLPSANFLMKLKIYEPCFSPENATLDRCLYPLTKEPASDGLSPPAAPPNPPMPPSGEPAHPPLPPGSLPPGRSRDAADAAFGQGRLVPAPPPPACDASVPAEPARAVRHIRVRGPRWSGAGGGRALHDAQRDVHAVAGRRPHRVRLCAAAAVPQGGAHAARGRRRQGAQVAGAGRAPRLQAAARDHLLLRQLRAAAHAAVGALRAAAGQPGQLHLRGAGHHRRPVRAPLPAGHPPARRARLRRRLGADGAVPDGGLLGRPQRPDAAGLPVRPPLGGQGADARARVPQPHSRRPRDRCRPVRAALS